MSMTIQSSVKHKILANSSETPKVENTPAEMLRNIDQQMEKRADDGSEMDEAHASRYLVHSGADKKYYNLGDIYTRRLQEEKLAKINIYEIIARNGVPCTAYHPEMDGQSERAIRTLEGMLRSYVIDYDGRWGVHLP
ncbi:putative reverse transcriptase domain-containing protein, partial [Tanacetum coccineum]